MHETTLNNLQGLSFEEVENSCQVYGNNLLPEAEKRVLLHALKEVALQPMFICW